MLGPFLSTRPTRLGESPPVSLLLRSRGGLVIGFDWCSGCTLEFPSAELFPLRNFQEADCRCQWTYSFGVREVWWMDCQAVVTDKWGCSVQCTVYSVQCSVYSVQCTVYSVQCTVYNVQKTVYTLHCICTMYSKVVLLILWREPQCSSVWGVKPLARLLLCLTPQEESRAVVGDIQMESNLVVGDTKME